MRRDASTRIMGWMFVAAAAMLWLGWVLLPVHLGPFFRAEDFSAVYAHVHLWIWLYRVHLFGIITAVMALIALGALVTDSEARVLVWPGAGVAAAGLLVWALGSAFYYHFGAWGSLELGTQPPAAAAALVQSLAVPTEYVTCLVRFSRVFSGLGLLVLAWGLVRGGLLPQALAAVAAVYGVGSMALTMGLPDALHLWAPLFHLLALWLAATGAVVLRSGLRVAR
jgi:hypothetical protein